MCRISNRSVRLVLGLAAGCWLLGSQTDAARRVDKSADEASPQLQQVLQSEAEGGAIDRKQALQPVLEKFPDSRQLRWQSGYVFDGKRWISFDQIPERVKSDADDAEYLKLRESTPPTPDGLMELANWCRKRGLLDQERAHLTAMLDAAPDDPAVRERLGYRRTSGRWLTLDEMDEAKRSAKEAARDLEFWRPKIENIGDRLAASSPKRRESALRDLAAIDTASAIPAIELVLSTHNELLAADAVEQLARMPAVEAAVGLSRQAVFSPWPAVRERAAENLKPRKLAHYVPPLLSVLYTPVQSRIEIYTGWASSFHYKHTFVREGAENIQVLTLETTDYRTSPQAERERRNQINDALPRLLAQTNAERAAKDEARVREAAVESQNALIEELNSRVHLALTTATGQQIPAQPAAWWQWWNDFNEVAFDGPKRVIEVGEEAEIGTPLFECLAAGTLVWTSRGEVPVEQIQIGDLVLSKNVETGELDYKPVLKTTVRPEMPVVRTHLADGSSLTTTGSHPFWVSGQGWTRAREFEPGLALHGVTGTSAVESTDPAGREPTYNLIVADFHTYFVGQSKVLSHDVTIAEPTDVEVPGLDP